jgi:hypothetical protein
MRKRVQRRCPKIGHCLIEIGFMQRGKEPLTIVA